MMQVPNYRQYPDYPSPNLASRQTGSAPDINWQGGSNMAPITGPIYFAPGGPSPMGGPDTGGQPMDMWNMVIPKNIQGRLSVSGGGPTNFGAFDINQVKGLFPQLMMEDAAKNMAEQTGMEGKRWSSVLGQKQADAAARATEEFTLSMFDKWLQDQQEAAARGLQAGGMNQAQAWREYMAPIDIAGAMSGAAGAAQNAENQLFGTGYDIWKQGTPEAAWAAYAPYLSSLTGSYPSGQTGYDEGWASKLMGVSDALSPEGGAWGMISDWLGKGGGGGGGGFVGPPDYRADLGGVDWSQAWPR